MNEPSFPARLRDCAARVAHAEAADLLTEAADAYERLLALWTGQLARSVRLEAALDDLLTGAEQQSQSHADVAAKCRAALEREAV